MVLRNNSGFLVFASNFKCKQFLPFLIIFCMFTDTTKRRNARKNIYFFTFSKCMCGCSKSQVTVFFDSNRFHFMKYVMKVEMWVAQETQLPDPMVHMYYTHLYIHPVPHYICQNQRLLLVKLT